MHSKLGEQIWQYCFSNLGGYLFRCFKLQKDVKSSKAKSPKKEQRFQRELSQRETARIVAAKYKTRGKAFVHERLARLRQKQKLSDGRQLSLRESARIAAAEKNARVKASVRERLARETVR